MTEHLPADARRQGSGDRFQGRPSAVPAWTRIRPILIEQDIAAAGRHAEELAQQRNIRDDTPETPLQVLDNQRAVPRQRVLKLGIIEFNGSAIDCVVRNISETGAALDVASPVGILSEFKLLLSCTG